jgi:hypothetical protein
VDKEDRQRWADRRFTVHSDFLNLTRTWIEGFNDYRDQIAEDWLLCAMPECTEVANAADESLPGLEGLSFAAYATGCRRPLGRQFSRS